MSKDLEAELDLYRNGHKGACYACETVGEENRRLTAALKRLILATKGYSVDPYEVQRAVEALEGRELLVEVKAENERLTAALVRLAELSYTDGYDINDANQIARLILEGNE